MDLNSSAMKRGRNSNAINDLIDAALVAESANEARRTYLGASAIGDRCHRKIQYGYMGAPGKPFTGQTLRIFNRGHRGEEVTIQWLRQAGFALRTEDQHGHQFGFSVADGRFAGHVDGVIVDGPEEFGPYPRLWECKWLGAKGWRALDKHGLTKQYPQYADQVALYQAYLELQDNPALFTAVNSDTLEILHLDIVFDAARAQEASDRAVKIIQASEAGDILPRIADDPDGFPCRFCDYREHCYDGSQ